MGNHEDDWDRNRCSHGVLGYESFDGGGMYGAQFDSEDEASRIMELSIRDHRKTQVDEILGWNRKYNKEKTMRDNESTCDGSCTVCLGKPAVEMRPGNLSYDYREIYMAAKKATAILTETFEGLDKKDQESLRSIVVQGKDAVDPKGESFMAAYGKVRTLLHHIVDTVSGGQPVPVFDIWREGVDDEDEKKPAELLAKDIPGRDFPDAVDFWYRNTADAEKVYGPLVSKGEKAWRKFWLWGSRLYDNEQDARRRFG